MPREAATRPPAAAEAVGMLEAAGFAYLRAERGCAVYRRRRDGATALVPAARPGERIGEAAWARIERALAPVESRGEDHG